MEVQCKLLPMKAIIQTHIINIDALVNRFLGNTMSELETLLAEIKSEIISLTNMME